MSFRPPANSKLVPPESVERLQRKFVERKALEEQERFWTKVQDSKQPRQQVDWDQLPV